MLSDLDAQTAPASKPTCAAAVKPLTPAQLALAAARKFVDASPGAPAVGPQQSDDTVQRMVVKMRIDLLKPHPRQADIFSHVPDTYIEMLARDMEENGLQHPIEVLPDYTIIAGHCRVKAARRIGRPDIDAIIRYDLATQDELAIEQYMISDNFLRRQLSPLERARCALSLREITMRRQCDGEQLDRYAKAIIRQTPSTRDEIGGLLGISGREVSRLIRVLDTPPEVQAAFDAGKLSLVLADKIAGLDEAKQQALAVAIRKGDDAAVAARRTIASAAGKSVAITSEYRKFLKAINSATEQLDGNIDEIKVHDDLVSEHVATLKSVVPLARRLIQRERAEKQRHQQNMEKALDRLINLGDCSRVPCLLSRPPGPHGGSLMWLSLVVGQNHVNPPPRIFQNSCVCRASGWS